MEALGVWGIMDTSGAFKASKVIHYMTISSEPWITYFPLPMYQPVVDVAS